MNHNFMSSLENTLLSSAANMKRTENGALGYRTTGKALLDLNFAVSSLRSRPPQATRDMFAAACNEHLDAAIAWLFFARDIRGGMGERRLFRIAFRYLIDTYPHKARSLVPLVSEYGRWDDLIMTALNTPIEDEMLKVVSSQLIEDQKNMKAGKPVSLLAKWMPSYKASSAEKRHAAARIAKKYGASPEAYMQTLKALRHHLVIVEGQMSRREWGKINYEHVPSKANLLYNNAFLRHDETRRRQYLGKLEKGEAKINSSAAFPHDIVAKYTRKSGWYAGTKEYDPAIEAMWKSLPDYVKGAGNTLVVADGSSSMRCNIPGSSATALDVANALAIYFAERMTGQFKDTYITFSSRPQLVPLRCDCLKAKLDVAHKYNECSNTNIEAVFKLILNTALSHDMSQDDLPANVLILSDMEFDHGTCGTMPDAALFKSLERLYAKYGYKLPRLTFWNIMSRTGAIPVRENEAGVALVSGFSPAIASMVLSGETDPYTNLMKTITSKRYHPVLKALGYNTEA